MPKVKVYSTRTCVYCHMEKDYLRSKGIDFEEILLDDHPDKAAEAMHVCNSMGVPCTHIIKDDGGEAKILGFDKAKLDAALGIA
jgi:glutaredoxin 3